MDVHSYFLKHINWFYLQSVAVLAVNGCSLLLDHFPDKEEYFKSQSLLLMDVHSYMKVGYEKAGNLRSQSLLLMDVHSYYNVAIWRRPRCSVAVLAVNGCSLLHVMFLVMLLMHMGRSPCC